MWDAFKIMDAVTQTQKHRNGVTETGNTDDGTSCNAQSVNCTR